MKIAILGTGDVGRALGTGFAALGHEVRIGSREAGHEGARAWADTTGPNCSHGTHADAAAFGDWVVFAVRGTAAPELAKNLASALDGKIVIDATNPLDFSGGFPPELAIRGDDSGGEALQRAARGARVVKAFNTVPNALMVNPDLPGGPPTMFIAGDDGDAKAEVTGLLGAFGWDVEDLGGIRSSRWLEAMCMAWVMSAATSGHARSAFKLLRG